MLSEDATVHVIDDDQAARDSLAFLLKTAKLAVKTYESARAFLDVATGIKSGCIITDVRMPEIDGIELLRRLKAPQGNRSGNYRHRAWGRAACCRGDEDRGPGFS